MTRRLGFALAALAAPGLALVPTAPASAARRHYTIEFRPVRASLAPASVTTTTAPIDLAAAQGAVAACDDAAVAELAAIPTTTLRDSDPEECVVFPNRPGRRTDPRYYLGPAGRLAVEDTRAEFVSGDGWTVKIEFTKAGTKEWDHLAKAQFHQQVAITFEGVVVAAPTIQPSAKTFSSFDGVAVVSGDFTQKEASEIALALRYANGR